MRIGAAVNDVVPLRSSRPSSASRRSRRSREAERALAIVSQWIAERHALDAAFYRTLENPAGERFHLDLLLAEYPDSPLAEGARSRLTELAAAAGPVDGGTPEGGGS